jgi:hypothetical protein
MESTLVAYSVELAYHFSTDLYGINGAGGITSNVIITKGNIRNNFLKLCWNLTLIRVGEVIFNVFLRRMHLFFGNLPNYR